MKRAVSVTLDQDNLLWLKGQAAASARGSLSEILDGLVRAARTAGRSEGAAVRSVVGSIDLPAEDDALERADGYVRDLFERSLTRPMIARERAPRQKRRGRS
jgi:hypothetical protein